jgi:gentisate 1,2-dioxygenase
MQELDTDPMSRLTRHLSEASLWAHWLGRPVGKQVEPVVWSWKDIYSCLIEAGDAVKLGGVSRVEAGKVVKVGGEKDAAERRVVLLVNPGLAEQKITSKTLMTSFQLVKPGEVAWTHRHTMAAFRFVIQGKGAYTTVEGEQFFMEPGDLILTPNWMWHGHTNESDESIVWMDGLDAPLVRGTFDSAFQEEFETQSQPIMKTDGYTNTRLGLVRPHSTFDKTRAPCIKYKWSDTIQTLEDLSSEVDQYDGTLLEYINPITGGPTLPTISCRVQSLPSESSLKVHRHTGTTIYHVVSGKGYCEVDGIRLDWGEKDTFIVPSWRWHRLVNTEKQQAILFSKTDIPVLQSLGLYREEAKK